MSVELVSFSTSLNFYSRSLNFRWAKLASPKFSEVLTTSATSPFFLTPKVQSLGSVVGVSNYWPSKASKRFGGGLLAGTEVRARPTGLKHQCRASVDAVEAQRFQCGWLAGCEEVVPGALVRSQSDVAQVQGLVADSMRQELA